MMSVCRDGRRHTAQTNEAIMISARQPIAIGRAKKSDLLRSGSGAISMLPDGEEPLTGAMKR